MLQGRQLRTDPAHKNIFKVKRLFCKNTRISLETTQAVSEARPAPGRLSGLSTLGLAECPELMCNTNFSPKPFLSHRTISLGQQWPSFSHHPPWPGLAQEHFYPVQLFFLAKPRSPWEHITKTNQAALSGGWEGCWDQSQMWWPLVFLMAPWAAYHLCILRYWCHGGTGKYVWHVLLGMAQMGKLALFPPLHTGCSCKFSFCQITQSSGLGQGSWEPSCTECVVLSCLPQFPLPVVFIVSGWFQMLRAALYWLAC